jgi:hypothetical protein
MAQLKNVLPTLTSTNEINVDVNKISKLLY